MKKDLIIKLTIVFLVIVFGYSVFWFFKAGQIEKQLNKFISENSTNISVAKLTVTGFPVAHKIYFILKLYCLSRLIPLFVFRFFY